MDSLIFKIQLQLIEKLFSVLIQLQKHLPELQ